MNEEHYRMTQLLHRVAEDLAQARQHVLVAAQHFTQAEVPRGCAHTFAAEGHLSHIRDALAECAKLHASKARTE